jgi:hypothetical protein
LDPEQSIFDCRSIGEDYEGSAARELRNLRPDLFVDPRFAEFGLGQLAGASASRRLSMPLAGEDLFVTPAILEEYVVSALSMLQDIKNHFLSHQKEQYPIT